MRLEEVENPVLNARAAQSCRGDEGEVSDPFQHLPAVRKRSTEGKRKSCGFTLVSQYYWPFILVPKEKEDSCSTHSAGEVKLVGRVIVASNDICRSALPTKNLTRPKFPWNLDGSSLAISWNS